MARVVFHLPASASLKDKRQAVKSLLAQVQREHHVSAAEVDEHDKLQIAVLGLACVSTDSRHADEMIAKAVNFLERRATEAELLGFETEIVHVL